MPDKDIEEQRKEFLRNLEIKEKELDAQLAPKNDISLNDSLSKKSLKTERETFLKNLEQKEQELSNLAQFEDSSKKSSSDIAKFKFYRTMIGAVVLLLVMIVISKALMKVSYTDTVTQTTNNNITQVKMALMNYYDQYKKLPVDDNSLINTDELINKRMLGTKVEEQCQCKFYLVDDGKGYSNLNIVTVPKDKHK